MLGLWGLLYCSCVFEQKILVTDLFFQIAPGNKFLYTKYSQATCICEVEDQDIQLLELVRSVVFGKKLPLLPSEYFVSEGWLVYNKEWDKTADNL